MNPEKIFQIAKNAEEIVEEVSWFGVTATAIMP